MISGDIIKIGETEFTIIEDYLPQYQEEANKQSEQIKHIYKSSIPISIPIQKTPSFISSDRNSESSPRILVGFSPIGMPIGYLHNQACKKRPYAEKFKCSIIIKS